MTRPLEPDATAPVRLLMIEDDMRLADMLRSYLSGAGFEVAVAEDGARGLRHLERAPYDLVLLDLMLPDADGLDLCRSIRAQRPTLPIIMVTARGDTMDRVVGLELGADDYLAKPYEPRELLARIRAVLRRRGAAAPGAGVLSFGRLEIDRGARQVRVAGEPRALTARQYDILLALAERAGRVLSRDQIVMLTDADTGEAPERAVDVHMARIRAAIEDDPRSPRRIITVRGAGYVFAQAQD
ncbi:MAG: response regulator transcription factor [Burkholderiaceae bacterium]